MLKDKKKYTPRFRSRIYAVSALYHYDINPYNPEDILQYVLKIYNDKPKVQYFCKELFFKTIENIDHINKILESSLKDWDIDRLSTVDRNIIRLAICEFVSFDLIPPEATINEAVELTRIFGNADSSRFVNAVLDKVATKLNLLKKNYENSVNQ